MSLKKIVKYVAENTNQRQDDALPTVKAVFDAIKNLLKAGEPCIVVGFGRFVVKQKEERAGRNPRTGEKIRIKAHKVPRFLPTVTLKDMVNDQPAPQAKKAQTKKK